MDLMTNEAFVKNNNKEKKRGGFARQNREPEANEAENDRRF